MTLSDALRQLADKIEEVEHLTTELEAVRTELREVSAKVPAEEKLWYSVAEATKYIGRSKSFLDKDRIQKFPAISFRRDGERSILYHKDQLDEFIQSKIVRKRK